MHAKNDRIVAGGQTRGDRENAPFVSVVVPCLNEAEGLAELHRRVSAVCSGLLMPYEIVLVNDGSTDATWPAMIELCRLDACVVAVNFSRNFGQQAAITAGLGQARGDRILIMDADLQDPPELLPDMLAMMEDGADVVYGLRRSRNQDALLKRAAASVFYRVLDRISNTPIPRDTGEFRLIDRRVAEALLALPERHRFVRGLVSWVGFRQAPLEYDRQARFAGNTHWPLAKMVRLAIDAITAFSLKPLALAGWIGLLVSAGGAALLIWVVGAWLLFAPPSAAIGLLAGVLLLSGAQMMMLAILGAYVGRLHEESRGRPLFIISDVAGRTTAAEDSSKADRDPARSAGRSETQRAPRRLDSGSSTAADRLPSILVNPLSCEDR